ncbi:MAG: helix-turn-helix domain-containing protein [Gammaproteobacteria bacterium]|nr:helix-turn-helix domain-containing protein [Gammaproteobacteria bacterium]
MVLFFAQIVAILSVLLLAFGYLKTEPKDISARLFFVIAFGIVCYLINGMSMSHVDPALRVNPGNWGVVLNLGINSIPGLFMLYCYYVFQDGARAPRWLIALLVVELILDHLNYRSFRPSPFLSVQNDSSLTQFLLGSVPDFIQLFFAAFAVYWTARGWRSDLVESRRFLRWVIVSVQGGLILMIVFLENYLLNSASPLYGGIQRTIVYVIAAITFVMVLSLLKFDYVTLGRVIRKVTPFAPNEHAEDALQSEVKRFNKVFREDRVYREHGLTIANLAAKVDLPEYRLRALINKHLGYRNFNALLHEYRIEDASQMLADRTQRHLPVLTIALTVGYQSITPFNNAFRQMKGVTPTEFRKRALQENS